MVYSGSEIQDNTKNKINIQFNFGNIGKQKSYWSIGKQIANMVF